MSVADGERNFGSCCRMGYSATEIGGVASHQFRSTINDNLGRVRRLDRKLPDVVLLALVDGVERERIAPAKVIPVGDVLAEHNGLRSGNKLLLVEPGQQRIGGRAIGTAFRSEEFNEDWLALRVRGLVLLSAHLRGTGAKSRGDDDGEESDETGTVS